MATGSVSKGSLVLIGARLGGMLGGFLLFLLLTWRSREAAGVFRTAITFLVIMETLPLLGMHRWLANEIAHQGPHGRAVFRLACWFAAAVAAIGTLAYAAIAAAGIYPPEISLCLAVVATAAIPSAISLCVNSALVGIGASHQSGFLTLAEMATRAILAAGLVLAGGAIVWVVVIYAVLRWLAAIAGLLLVRAHLPPTKPIDPAPLRRAFLLQLPNLSLAMIGFLAIRSAPLLLLPWLRGESVAGIYAAPLQLFDLLLLLPTVLTISTNYSFVEAARGSQASRRRNINELTSITASYLLPLALLAFVLARPMIELLFGSAYDESVLPFRLLLVCAGVIALDQVLSLAMVTAGDYRSDRTCMVTGACVTIALTWLLSGPFGAAGAAAGMLAGTAATLALRLRLMHRVVRLGTLAAAMRLQCLASIAAAGSVVLGLATLPLTGSAALLLIPVGGLVYIATLHLSGGFSKRRVGRLQAFMARRG